MNASYFLFLSRSSLVKPSSSSSVLKLVYEFKIYCSKFFDKKQNFNKHQTFISHMSHDVDFVSSCGGYDKETKVC
ncbi:hypothetical protein YC2023_055359 [Brassica napus]